MEKYNIKETVLSLLPLLIGIVSLPFQYFIAEDKTSPFIGMPMMLGAILTIIIMVRNRRTDKLTENNST